MPKEKFQNYPKIRDESLGFLNYLGLWSQCGSDWSLTIKEAIQDKEEIQEAINQPIEEKKSKPTRKVVGLSVLTTLALLGAAIWIQAPKIYQSVREVGINSVEQLNDQVKQEIGGNY